MADKKEQKEKIGIKDKLKAKFFKLTLSTRILIKGLPLLLVVFLFLAGAAVLIDRLYVHKVFEEKTTLLLDIILAAATDPIITEDEAVLNVLAAQIMDKDVRIRKVSFYDEEGKILSENSKSHLPKGLVEKGLELDVNGEKFGGFKIWLDFRDLPVRLKQHDLYLFAAVSLLFLLLIPIIKIISKKYFQLPLEAILERFLIALKEKQGELVPLSGFKELIQLEPLMEKTTAMKERLMQVEESIQKLLAENEKLKRQPAVPATQSGLSKIETGGASLSPDAALIPAKGYLPESDDLLALIKDLLGREVVLKASDNLILPSKAPLYVATYIDANKQLLELILVDVPMAAYCGAALAMMPIAICKEAIKAKKCEGELLGNAREVLNIAASLFNKDQSTHVKLANLYLSTEALPAEVSDFLASKPEMHSGFEFDISDYGAGKLSIYARNIEAKSSQSEPSASEAVQAQVEVAPTAQLVVLPEASDWASLMSDLTGKEVEGEDLDNWDQFKEEGAFLASYANTEGVVKKILVTDMALGASASASLAMLSPALVKESVDQKSLNDDMKGNLKEIFNIAASALNKGEAAAVKLVDMFDLKSELPDGVKSILAGEIAAKSACHLKVPGYGEGKLILLSL